MQATQPTHDATSELNHMLEICRDGQNGFKAAAEAVDDPSLKAELMQYSMQRQDFAGDLKSAIESLGEAPHDGGSVSAALHRGWINLKAAVAKQDNHAVLAECERGEDAAVKAYREAVLRGLPVVLLPLAESHLEQIQRVHDRVKMLRDTYKHA
jgi:uncharacterized protein (TIGR02284 family)